MKRLILRMTVPALALAFVGCKGDIAAKRSAERAEMEPVEPIGSEETPTETPTVETFPRVESPVPEIETVAVEEWQVDTDGDGIPNFIEVDLVDPETGASCLVGACAEASQVGMEEIATSVNTIVLLDASQSMGNKVDGKTRLDLAKESVNEFYKTVPMNDVFDIGLVAFGHVAPDADVLLEKSCEAVSTVEPLGAWDERALDKKLDAFEAGGWTPLAAAIEHAAELFPKEPYHFNRLIIISDGHERCDGDPVQVARELAQEGVINRIDVVGFEGADIDSGALSELADVTKGDYYAASDVQTFSKGMQTAMQTTRQMQDAWLCGIRKASELAACYERVNDLAMIRATDILRTMPVESPDAQVVHEVVRDINEGRQEIDRALNEFAGRIDRYETEIGTGATGIEGERTELELEDESGVMEDDGERSSLAPINL